MKLPATRLLLCGLACLATGRTAPAAEPIRAEQFGRLQALIKPDPGEDRWAQIPWVTDLWQARRLAAAQGKPILLWEMDGHPLGCTCNHGVAGGALAFADAEIVRMATEDYVPVAADDWYQRRRDDAEGRFFRRVADQGPRKGEGGSTRQGIYCFTADGRLLAYKNAGQAPDVMRDVLKQGLREWQKLPADRRKAGAVKVDDPDKTDPIYSRTPPPGGLIVTVYTRI